MGFKEMQPVRCLLVRVEHDADLINFLTELAKNQGIATATFTAIGALKNAKLGFYHQTKHEYIEEAVEVSVELASCIGNISIKDNQPFVHAHAVLADQNGNVKAGHLLMGKVFAAEIHLTELKGEKISRTKDQVTRLSLWHMQRP